MPEIYFDHPTDYLNFEFRLRRQRRPAYSLRAFARDLQMSPSSLCDFMKGRHGLSEERALAVSQILKWTPTRREHFCDLVTMAYSPQQALRKKAKLKIQARLKNLKNSVSLDQFQVVSDWPHMALLCFVQMEATAMRTEDLAKRLKMSIPTTRGYLERLKRVGLLDYERGRWSAPASVYQVGNGAPSEAIKAFHNQILELAARAIETVSLDERASLSLLFSIRQDKFALLEQELREAVMKVLSHYVESSPHDSVQALTLQMFPIWQKEN